MVLKQGLVRRDLLWGLCPPEIEKQELKKPQTPNNRVKTQEQEVAVKNILNAHFTAKWNRCSLSTFSKRALKLQVTNCKDSDISVLLHSFSQVLKLTNWFLVFKICIFAPFDWAELIWWNTGALLLPRWRKFSRYNLTITLCSFKYFPIKSWF